MIKFKLYGTTLDCIIEEALKRKDILLSEEIKLTSVFKDFLPTLVINKVAYFNTDDSFFYNLLFFSIARTKVEN